MNLIFKIVPASLWQNSLKVGIFLGAPVDLSDGYIHLSDARQVVETATKHFRGQENLLLVAVDADTLGPDLRWELSRGGALFPHLYKPLATAQVLWTKPLPMKPDGTHLFPDLTQS